MPNYQAEKQFILEYFYEMENASPEKLLSTMKAYTSDQYRFYGVHPFNELTSRTDVVEKVWQPIFSSFSHVQRRQDVFMAGTNEISNDTWVMSMGHFMGLFDNDWLGIRSSKKLIMLKYAEFNCIENHKITKTGLWLDIISLMQQVGMHPLPAQTGSSIIHPAPLLHDGLLFTEQEPLESVKTLQVLNTMIDDLSQLNKTGNDRAGPEVMSKNWHENMAWYGPAGIGSTYTIGRYQLQHMYPFREGLSDKVFNGHICRFAEGKFACFFGWPNLSNRATGGFLGLPSSNMRADMRVVDVYSRKEDKLFENWVLIDIPYWLKQQGVDILQRTSSIENP